MSGEGMGKPRGFVLAPSRLARPPQTEDGDKNNGPTAKPLFSGLKASKLGVLTESNLKPSGGAIHAAAASNGDAPDVAAVADTKKDEKTGEASPSKPAESPAAAAAAGFSFTPLNKEKATENGEKEEDEVESGGVAFSFGQKMGSRVENVATMGAVFGEQLSDRVVTPVRPKKSSQGSVGSVFGENLSDRLVEPSEINGADAEKVSNDDTENPSVASPSKANLEEVNKENKEKGNMLFSAAATATPGKEIAKNQNEESSKKSLSEAAAEYTESHSNKRKYDEVTVVTGEEEESNVLKMNVKLYLFCGDDRTYTERGRGMLRLNDAPVSTPGHLKSRIVMRTTGSLRVVLNTKLWPEMVCERPNEKSLRISAMDGDVARVFLISASPKETDKLFTALEYRLSQLKTDKAEESTEPPEKKASLGD